MYTSVCYSGVDGAELPRCLVFESQCVLEREKETISLSCNSALPISSAKYNFGTEMDQQNIFPVG